VAQKTAPDLKSKTCVLLPLGRYQVVSTCTDRWYWYI